MSESLTVTEWAAPEIAASYHADVKARADEWLAIWPNAKRRPEIREPEKAAHALYLLNETDTSQNEIARITGLPLPDVGQLIFRRPELWEKRRPKLAMDLAATTEELIDTMGRKLQDLRDNPEKLDKEGIKDIALAIGIVSDKAAAFNGMATTVVEHRTGVSLDDAMKAIADAKAKVADKLKEAVIEAEVIG